MKRPWLGSAAALALALMMAAPALAQATPPTPVTAAAPALPPSGAAEPAADDPPGRVGRLVELQGESWLYDPQSQEWISRPNNWPLTSGDRVKTAPDARVEIDVGSTTLRLGGGVELSVLRLDDEQFSVHLDAGSLALRFGDAGEVGRIVVVTPEGRWSPRQPGHYRIDRSNEASQATVWRGELWFDGADTRLGIAAGRRVDVWLQGPRLLPQYRWTDTVQDAFAEWVQRDEQSSVRAPAAQYVSPEMTGWQELDRHGRWAEDAEVGAVWLPTTVVAGWAPYRFGQWAWVAPWGWTWVDAAPWGFAPFHYGRWLMWRGRWAWSPGYRVPRPVYAPALVAWFGGPAAGVGVHIGAPGRGGVPPVGWVPLAPWEPYHPHYRAGERHRHEVNLPQRRDRPGFDGRPQAPRGAPGITATAGPAGPAAFANQGVPGAITMLPGNAFGARRPVAPLAAAADLATGHGVGARPPTATATPLAPTLTAPPPPPPRRPQPQPTIPTQLPSPPPASPTWQAQPAPRLPARPPQAAPAAAAQPSDRANQPPMAREPVAATVTPAPPSPAAPGFVRPSVPPGAPPSALPPPAAPPAPPRHAGPPTPRPPAAISPPAPAAVAPPVAIPAAPAQAAPPTMAPRGKPAERSPEGSRETSSEASRDVARPAEARQRSPEQRQDMRDRQIVR